MRKMFTDFVNDVKSGLVECDEETARNQVAQNEAKQLTILKKVEAKERARLAQQQAMRDYEKTMRQSWIALEAHDRIMTQAAYHEHKKFAERKTLERKELEARDFIALQQNTLFNLQKIKSQRHEQSIKEGWMLPPAEDECDWPDSPVYPK